LERAAAVHGFRLVAPPVRLCTDNAVMVAWAGLERLRLGLADGIEFAPRPRWPLEAIERPGAAGAAVTAGEVMRTP
jgi:N6-L-threonylcarbamoyladenine synthase